MLFRSSFKQKLENYCQKEGLDLPAIFEVSAWQAKGLKPLLVFTYDLVQNSDFIPLFEEEPEEVHYQLEEEVPFTLTKLDAGYWQLSGDKIEKLYAMTNMAHDESVARFARQLRSMGVDQALREAGAESGDLVDLAGYQFEFMD